MTKGLLNLQSTVDTVNHNSYVIDQLAEEAEDILQSVKDIRLTALQLRDDLVNELQGQQFCPGNQELAENTAAKEIIDRAREAIPLLEDLSDFATDDVDSLEGGASEVQITAENLQTETDEVDFTGWQGLVVLIPYTIIPAVLMAGCIMAAFGVEMPCMSCFLNWFAFPVLYILVILACIISTGMMVGASINADFCLPGGRKEDNTVDTNVLKILQLEGYHNETVEYRVAKFYIGNCVNDEDPFEVNISLHGGDMLDCECMKCDH